MRGVLVLIQPLDPATGTRISIRCGISRNSRTLSADGEVWHSAISRAPKITMEFFDDNLLGQLQIGRGQIIINHARLIGYTRKYLDSLVWIGSPISIWSGDGAATADMTVEFVGTIRSGTADIATRQMQIQFEVDRKIVDVPMLNLEYGGGGGADGDVEIRGQLKPACFGNPVNVPVFFFDQVKNIGQIDAYGNVTAIDNLYEDAASFGAKAANYASYALLAAATVVEGTWATCVAEGMIRLGAPPRGVITCDPVAGSGTPGAMMLRWLQTHAGVSAGKINSASFTTLDTTLNTLLGHSPAVSFYVQGQANVLERIQAMCSSCNAVPLLTPDGKIGVARVVSADAPVITLQRHGGNPTVLEWKSIDPPIPFWRLKMAAELTYRVHGLGEIDYEDDLVDLGDHVPGEAYRQGNIVRLPSDGKRYIYINATPSTNAPPNVIYWDEYEAAPDATVVRYADGVPVETGRPAAGGGLNDLNDSSFLTWTLNAGVARISRAASDGHAIGNQPWNLTLSPGTAQRTATGPLVPVVASQPYYFSIDVQRNASVNAAAQLKVGGDWLNAAGGVISAANEMVPQTTATLTAGAIPVQRRWAQLAPALAVHFRPKIYVPLVTAPQATGSFRVEMFRISAVEFGATYTQNEQGWVGGILYRVGSIVQYANSSYIAIAEHTSNVSFPPGHASNTQFQIFARQGLRTEKIYIRSNATPATPTGDLPASWSTSRVSTPADTAEWESSGNKDGSNVLVGVWSTPVKISGQILRGEYSAGLTYYSNDLVTFNGGTYYTLLNNFSGQSPTGTAQANTYWGVQSAPGSQAGSGSQTITLTMNATVNGGTTNIRTLADAAGYTGGDLTLTCNVTGTYRGAPAGYGIRTGTFPTDKTIAITINNNSGALVEGGGGAGGIGGSGGGGGVGGAGSDAYFIEHNVTGGLIVNSGAALKAGGGGGGGGGSKTTLSGGAGEEEPITTAGGGGGGGAPNGLGGAGGTGTSGNSAGAGNPGTTSGGGSGGLKEGLGSGNGGAGATYNGTGTSGANANPIPFAGGVGGDPGYAVRKNGKTCTVSGAGTITGLVG